MAWINVGNVSNELAVSKKPRWHGFANPRQRGKFSSTMEKLTLINKKITSHDTPKPQQTHASQWVCNGLATNYATAKKPLQGNNA
jgi:hypothetical protein